MNRRTVAAVAIVALVVAGSVSASPTHSALSPTFMTPFDPQGSFEVQALVDGFWTRVGELRYDRYVRERGLALPAAALAAPQVRVRLVQRGGGAAQIDRVTLGEVPPSRVAGASEADAVALAARWDNDVLDAARRTIEVAFPGKSHGAALRLAARIEPVVNEGGPLAYPPANLLEPVTTASAFYAYRPTPDGRAPAWPDTLDASRALFAERCLPTSGHPDGITYGWVANDRDTLYAEVDFTSDNTRDGNKDWSSVTVLRAGKLREFRVSEDETHWGRPSFVTTARASYHHKLYAFAIPFSELGVRDAREAGDLRLAFNAYGTTSSQWLSTLFHDFGTLKVGSTSAPFTVTIFDIYGSNLTLGNPYYANSGPDSSQFTIADGTCHAGLVLTPGQSCTFQVTFAPTVVANFQDSIVVTVLSAAGGQLTETLNVVGAGILPIPTFSAAGIAVLVLALCALGYFILRRR